MATSINTIPVAQPAVVVDFGWYYGLTPQRLPEISYVEEGITWPPGQTTLHSTTTLPVSSIPTNFATVGALRANFETKGTIVVNDYLTGHPSITYTGLALVGGIPSFTGCLGGTGTFAAGTAIYDPHFYVDQTVLRSPITFDALDQHGLGLPVTLTPPGSKIITWFWDFGNGFTGTGSAASTVYTYSVAPPDTQTTLNVTDDHGRTFSCAKRINLSDLALAYGTALRERSSDAGYR